MKQSELLRTAIDHLRVSGWAQDEYTTANHRHCMAGAVGCVGFELYMDDKQGAWDEIHAVIEEIVGQKVNVTAYNDRYAESIDDALAVMEKAAARLEERGE